MSVVPTDFDCTPRCRSTAHYSDLISVASQSVSTQVIINYISRCGNCAKGHDKYGRTLIQVCAALSDKWPVIDWLLKQKKVDINLKNVESGYTALHYSVFYGRIDNAVNLIKAGANLSLLDHDHMTFIDHAIRDRCVNAERMNFEFIKSYEVFTMGENINGTLGHNQPTAKKVPEPVDVFRRDSVFIKKVEMDKYHTLFLSDDGTVYSCGFGLGGRLGHDNEEPVLVPKQISVMTSIKEKENDLCIDIVATRDCSYFLTKNGVLWSCGLNNYQQLGHPGMTKVLAPMKVQFRQLKDRKITHIACGRFHVAVIVEDSGLFTFGLNAGQLGHPKGSEPYIQQALLVTKFNSKTEQIQKLVCSDLAIVCYTTKGDIYLLNDYKYRKVVKHVLNVTQLAVVGGKLETNAILEEENVDDELKIFYVQSKKLYIYHERENNNNNRTKLCLWTTKQRLAIEEIAVGTNAVVFSTHTGQVYTASLDRLAVGSKKTEYESSSLGSTFYDERAYQYLTPSPIPLLHRCGAITTDHTGRSIAALQYLPNAYVTAYPPDPHGSSNILADLRTLLDEAEESHDITLQINRHQTFPAHKYILCVKSPYFRERITSKDMNHLCIETEANQFINPDLFRMILEYIYTEKCPWSNLVEKIRARREEARQQYLEQMKGNDDYDIDDHRYFARLREQSASTGQSNQSTGQGSKSKKKKKTGNKGQTEKFVEIAETSEDQLREGLECFIELSKLLQLVHLRKGLESIKRTYQDRLDCAIIRREERKTRSQFTREALPHLHDVTIVADDGKKVCGHKCILTSRLEYFRHMFLAGWMESQTDSELKMALPSNLLEIIINYLYTDTISDKYKIEELCQIMVFADQLLIEHLKNVCEFHIANLVTFRDAAELLQFSVTYNANYLKIFVTEFICWNMATFLESRLLDNLDSQLLSDLTKSYRNLFNCMSYRMITPYSDCPSLEEFSLESDDNEQNHLDVDEQINLSNKKLTTQIKRKPLTKSRGSEVEQNLKSSPPKLADEAPSVVTSSQPKKRDEDKWTSVSSKKTSKNKISQASLNNNAITPTGPMIPGAVYSQKDVEKYEALKKAAEQKINPPKTASNMSVVLSECVKRSTPAKEESIPKNPWKIVSSTNTTPVSLKATMMAEKETSTNKTPISRPPSMLSPSISIPNQQQTPTLQNETNRFWSTLATSPPVALAGACAASSIPSSPPPPVSFKDILDQETRAYEALRQSTNKSLETIQTEELAIQALHRLYNSAQEFDMFISIERVTPEIANPIWPRQNSSTTMNSSSSGTVTIMTQRKGQK